ncbi:MAG: hypothetical protein WCF47_22910, partial [Pseudolabrys sp.]
KLTLVLTKWPDHGRDKDVCPNPQGIRRRQAAVNLSNITMFLLCSSAFSCAMQGGAPGPQTPPQYLVKCFLRSYGPDSLGEFQKSCGVKRSVRVTHSVANAGLIGRNVQEITR